MTPDKCPLCAGRNFKQCACGTHFMSIEKPDADQCAYCRAIDGDA